MASHSAVARFSKANPRHLLWAAGSVGALERALEAHGVSPVSFESEGVVLVSKVLARLRLLRRLRIVGSTTYVVPLMGMTERRLFPVCYWRRIVPYCYDCWQPDYDEWEGLFRRHRFALAFFSARQSASHFAERVPEMRCVWLAEATDPAAYSAGRPLVKRDGGVLELGRRWDKYHLTIVDQLRGGGCVHLYEPERGSVVFPSHRELVHGLSEARVSVIFPSSMTHPERTGNVETVTQKYFESMASRCLVLGHCPDELRDLYGYDPVVAVDWTNPGGQLLELLQHIDRYQDLVDRNYERTLELGAWGDRIPRLLSEIKATYG